MSQNYMYDDIISAVVEEVLALDPHSIRYTDAKEAIIAWGVSLADTLGGEIAEGMYLISY